MSSLYRKIRSVVDISIDNADQISLAYLHRTHKNKRLKIRGTYLEDIYNDKNPEITVKKSTQSGLSEWLVFRAICRAREGKSILYVLPTFDLKNQFVKERVDKSISYSNFYQTLINDTPKKFAESLSLKQIGEGTIAFVGSNTANAFISYPADDIIIDELDNCNQDNLFMASERQSASEDKRTIKVGNPTITNFGIDAEYKKTDQKIWQVKCSSCGKYIIPEFFQHIVEKVGNDWLVVDPKWTQDKEPFPICHLCKKPYDRFGHGRWVKKGSGKVSGYYISKMFSTYNTLSELLDRFSAGLSNDTAMQRFYNGDLGKAYTAEGSRITEEMLDACVKDYLLEDSTDKVCVAGIDVGAILNIIIAEMGQNELKIVNISEVKEFEEAMYLLSRYKVRCFVVDSRPETRESMKLVQKMLAHGSIGALCDYTTNKKDLQYSGRDNILSIDRTISLDSVKEYIFTQKIIFPRNARSIKNLYDQIVNVTRIYNEKRDYYEWVEAGADHYFHALNYMLLASRIIKYL